jgi:hypothetical protein
MLRCAYNLGKEHPELVKLVASNFPKFFKDPKIAEAALYSLKIADDNDDIDIDELLAEVKSSFGNQESVFKGIEVRDIFTISGKGVAEHAETEYDYWFEYHKEGLGKMLELRLDSTGNKATKVLKLDYVYDDSRASVERLGKDIINKMSAAFDQKDGISIAIPLNLNYKHWVGMVVSKHENEIKLEYMDSERNPMPQDLKTHLSKLLSEQYKDLTVSVNEKEVLMQTYGNCGLETVENIIEAISPGIRIDEESALLIHNLLLGDSLLLDDSFYHI